MKVNTQNIHINLIKVTNIKTRVTNCTCMFIINLGGGFYSDNWEEGYNISYTWFCYSIKYSNIYQPS